MFRSMRDRFNININDDAGYLDFIAARRKVIMDDRTVDAYVNRARWVANCIVCNGGMATEPGLKYAGCLDCGHVFVARFPTQDDQDAARASLLTRTILDQNWNPHKGETPDDLRRENIFSLGLPAVERAAALEEAGLVVPTDLVLDVQKDIS